MTFDTVTKFRAGRARFIAQMNEITRRARAGELSQKEALEAQALAKEGQSLGVKLDAVEKMIRGAEATLGHSLGGLGILPVLLAPPVIIAAMAAVSYLLAKMIDKTSTFLERSNYIEARVRQGATVEDAYRDFERDKPDDGGLFGDMSKLAWPLAIVAGAFLILSRR